MSATALDIARAAVDAAIDALDQHGLKAEAAKLPRLFAKALAEKQGIVHAILITKSGNAGSLADAVRSLLEKKYDTSIDLEEKADPSVLGGAILTIADERIDLSVRGALEQLERSLSASH
jgi:F0F1-type ATP synthase delta subunit